MKEKYNIRIMVKLAVHTYDRSIGPNKRIGFVQVNETNPEFRMCHFCCTKYIKYS